MTVAYREAHAPTMFHEDCLKVQDVLIRAGIPKESLHLMVNPLLTVSFIERTLRETFIANRERWELHKMANEKFEEILNNLVVLFGLHVHEN